MFQEDGADRFPHSHGLKRYSAEVIVDRFEPGRRQWNLDRVVYSAKDNKEFSLRLVFKTTIGMEWVPGNSLRSGVPSYPQPVK